MDLLYRRALSELHCLRHGHLLLDGSDRLRRVETLGAGLSQATSQPAVTKRYYAVLLTFVQLKMVWHRYKLRLFCSFSFRSAP